jgi:hypothetical protein
MVHLLFQKLATEPALFAEHASAYAALATLEAQQASLALQRRAMAYAVCAALGLLALGLSCLSALLASAINWRSMPAPWLMVALPAVLWLGCAASWWLAARQPRLLPFARLRQQWAADALMARDLAQTT